nr:hypothetical protein [Tanacetum cinerariifolium]
NRSPQGSSRAADRPCRACAAGSWRNDRTACAPPPPATNARAQNRAGCRRRIGCWPPCRARFASSRQA